MLVPPQAVCSCVIVVGVAQWLRLRVCKWQRQSLAAGTLCHTDGKNVCLNACADVMLKHATLPELRQRRKLVSVAGQDDAAELPNAEKLGLRFLANEFLYKI